MGATNREPPVLVPAPEEREQQAAADESDAASLRALLAAGADPNGNHSTRPGVTPLLVAVAKNKPALVHALLSTGARASHGGPAGITAATLAHILGHAECGNLIQRHLTARATLGAGASTSAADEKAQADVTSAAGTSTTEIYHASPPEISDAMRAVAADVKSWFGYGGGADLEPLPAARPKGAAAKSVLQRQGAH